MKAEIEILPLLEEEEKPPDFLDNMVSFQKEFGSAILPTGLTVNDIEQVLMELSSSQDSDVAATQDKTRH